MGERLWAPWRLEYIERPNETDGCVFCNAFAGSDDDLVVHRGRLAFVLLNRFPYTAGHLMVAPARHVGDYTELEDDEALELHELTRGALRVLEQMYAPQGYNVGWNLGRAAGAGVLNHIHLHVVPRWAGDTNFMPVLADTRVIPEALSVTQNRLNTAWPD